MGTKLNQVIHGDCIKQLSKFDEGSVNLVFADPPFNIGYEYDEYDDKRSCDDYLDWSRKWIAGVKRVLKPDGAFWLAIGDEYAAELKVLATRELGFICRNWVIWYYTFGVHCTHKFTRSHTHLLYFVKDAKRFTFNTDEIRVPSARQLVYGDKRANPKGRVPDDTWIVPPAGESDVATKRRSDAGKNGQGIEGSRDQDQYRDGNGPAGVSNRPGVANAAAGVDPSLPPYQGGTEGGSSDGRISALPSPSVMHDGWILRPQDLPEGFSADSNTWYYPRVCGTFKERTGFHGCQMPEQLLARIIRACSNDDQLVLDPFAGTGSTLIVAKKLGRSYLGVELSKQYVTETRSRLRKTKTGDPLDGFENPLTTVPNTANGTIRTVDGSRIRAKSIGGKAGIVSVVPGERTTEQYKQDRFGKHMNRGLIEAFRSVHDGFSVDWLLACPELVGLFEERCMALDLPGSLVDWNTRLLGLRKTKQLSVSAGNRTPTLDRDKLRECEFASEITLSRFRKEFGVTLDAILCDPRLVATFDARAAELVPEGDSAHFRWAALGLRKRAVTARRYAAKFFSGNVRVETRPIGSIGSIHYEKIPSRRGVYLLRQPGSTSLNSVTLYVGETANLRTWMQRRRESGSFETDRFRDVGGHRIEFRYARRACADYRHSLGLVSVLAGSSEPIWNYEKLAYNAA